MTTKPETPRGAAFIEAAHAERATHAGRGWPIEHDRERGPEHPLRLALDYLANGKPVEAGSLILAALDLIAEGSPTEELIGRVAEWKYAAQHADAEALCYPRAALRQFSREAFIAGARWATDPVIPGGLLHTRHALVSPTWPMDCIEGECEHRDEDGQPEDLEACPPGALEVCIDCMVESGYGDDPERWGDAPLDSWARCAKRPALAAATTSDEPSGPTS